MKPEHSFTEAQIEQYHNEGFIVVERLFDTGMAVAIIQNVNKLIRSSVRTTALMSDVRASRAE